MQQTIHSVTGGPLWMLAPGEEYFDKFVQIFGSNNHSVCFLNEKEEIVKIVSCEHGEIIYVIRRFLEEHNATATYVGTNPLTDCYIVQTKPKT